MLAVEQELILLEPGAALDPHMKGMHHEDRLQWRDLQGLRPQLCPSSLQDLCPAGPSNAAQDLLTVPKPQRAYVWCLPLTENSSFLSPVLRLILTSPGGSPCTPQAALSMLPSQAAFVCFEARFVYICRQHSA